MLILLTWSFLNGEIINMNRLPLLITCSIVFFSFLQPCFSKEPTPTVQCLKRGEIGIFKGEPGKQKALVECCPGFIFIENSAHCERRIHNQDSSGGAMPAQVCSACGNGHCDPTYETHCNCPKDCPN